MVEGVETTQRIYYDISHIHACTVTIKKNAYSLCVLILYACMRDVSFSLKFIKKNCHIIIYKYYNLLTL